MGAPRASVMEIREHFTQGNIQLFDCSGLSMFDGGLTFLWVDFDVIYVIKPQVNDTRPRWPRSKLAPAPIKYIETISMAIFIQGVSHPADNSFFSLVIELALGEHNC